MYELIYVSRAVMDLHESEMEAFLGRSRANNAEAGITGCLLHVHDRPAQQAYFVQALEGPESAVETTYQRISRDPLHEDVTVVHRGQRAAREFEGWRMRLATVTTDSVFTLLADDGIRPSESRPTFEWLRNPSLARALLELEAGLTATS